MPEFLKKSFLFIYRTKTSVDTVQIVHTFCACVSAVSSELSFLMAFGKKLFSSLAIYALVAFKAKQKDKQSMGGFDATADYVGGSVKAACQIFVCGGSLPWLS